MSNNDLIHIALEIGALFFSAYSAYTTLKMRVHILGLKLWMVQNFHQKPGANVLASCEETK